MRGSMPSPVAVFLSALALLALALPPTVFAQASPEAYQALHWRHIGPEGNRFSAAAGIPGNPHTYYVGAASGGVYKTTDGGVHWEAVFDDQPVQSIGALAVSASDPNVVWAGTGEGKIRSHISLGEGIYRSTDAGRTWTLMGLEETGRIPRVVIHPTNPDVVFACALGHAYDPQEDRGVFRTTDGGESWEKVLFVDENTGCSDLAMDPSNPRILFAGTWQLEIRTWGRTSGGPGGGLHVSRDGGRTLEVVPRSQAPGGDHHDIWIDPTDADRMIVAHDQGLSITINRGKTWFRQRLTNAQMYHVTVDNAVPYNVLGNKQDEPTYRGPSNSRLGGRGIPRGVWHHVGGGESGWATPDPTDPNIVWSSASGSGMVGGIVVRYEEDRRQYRSVEVWPEQSRGPASGVRYRFVWDAPLHISPHDNNTVYVGSQHVHRTTNGGQSWEVISPDLTLNDRSRMGPSGGLTFDNIGVEYAGVVFGIAESPIEGGLIWAGTNDGLLHLTRDGGESWTNVTENIPGFPEWIAVRSIAPSRFDAGTAYVAADGHQVNVLEPHVYRTRDYGESWEKITEGIPESPLSFTKIIVEDPVREGLLYLGTENGIYVSFDGGDGWQPLQTDMPHAPVSGIVVQEHFNDLVVGTYGRGFFILDDLGPIQQLTPEVTASAAHLFQLRPAYRFREITRPSTPYDDPTTGENPEYGASINYWLAAPAEEAPVIVIQDASGDTVRTLEGTNHAGVNRIYWDLEDEASTAVRLLTPPLYAEHMEVGPEGRSGPSTGRLSILRPPGRYTVTLSADGREMSRDLSRVVDAFHALVAGDVPEFNARLREKGMEVIGTRG